jgi:hypothetical protein
MENTSHEFIPEETTPEEAESNEPTVSEDLVENIPTDPVSDGAGHDDSTREVVEEQSANDRGTTLNSLTDHLQSLYSNMLRSQHHTRMLWKFLKFLKRYRNLNRHREKRLRSRN